MSDYRLPLEARPSITHINQFQHEQRLQLLADLLRFFQSRPEKPDTRRLRETYEDERFKGYPASFLKTLVGALAACGLLDLPPHKATRAAGYITTREGLLVLALFEQRLAG